MQNVDVIDERASTDLIKAFVNTIYDGDGRDLFGTPAATRDWLRASGLLDEGAELDNADRQRIVAVREALRLLMLANNGVAVDPAAAAPLTREAAQAPLRCRFANAGVAGLTPVASGVDAALGGILARVAVLMLRGVWPHLKVCRAGACHYAFYDRTKNQSRVWCAMRTCGSREKARTYQRRRRKTAGEAAPR